MLRLGSIGVGGKMDDKNYVEKIKESWGSVWYYFDKSIFCWIIESYPLIFSMRVLGIFNDYVKDNS